MRRRSTPGIYKESAHLAVCARPGLLDAPIDVGRMCHFVRDTDYGCEMRSRFWLGEIAHRDPDVTHSRRRQSAPSAQRTSTRDFAAGCISIASRRWAISPKFCRVLYRRVTLDNTF